MVCEVWGLLGVFPRWLGSAISYLGKKAGAALEDLKS